MSGTNRWGMRPDDQGVLLVERYLRADIDWPSMAPVMPAPEALRDHYRGCLLWGAIGDALGRAVEGWDPRAIRTEYGPEGLQRYVLWRGWSSGPIGTITDDTQLTMEVARSLLATGGRLDPGDLAQRLVAWLPTGQGKGQATTAAVLALAGGEPWWRAGQAVNSAGNGAAMQAAPVGLAWALHPTPWPLLRDAVLSVLPTHAHPGSGWLEPSS